MRVLSVLVLLLLGLGLGFASSPASAGPCPLHQDGAATHDRTVERPGDARAAAVAGEVTVVATSGDLAVPASQPARSGHLVPEGQPCCHVAAAVALSVRPAPEPRRVTRVAAPRSWLAPPAAPAADIFRPPAAT